MTRECPFIKIANCEMLRFNDRTSVQSPAALIGWYRERLAEAGNVAREWSYNNPVSAYVNHGRWVVRCPHCRNSSPTTHPIWKMAACDECGCLMLCVTFPDDWQEIERLLLLRPDRETQNWLTTETVDDIRRENLAHEVLV